MHGKHEIPRTCTYKFRNSWILTRHEDTTNPQTWMFDRHFQPSSPEDRSSLHSFKVSFTSSVSDWTLAVGRRPPALVANIGSKKCFRILQHCDVSVNLRFGQKMSWHFILWDILWDLVVISTWIYDVWPTLYSSSNVVQNHVTFLMSI